MINRYRHIFVLLSQLVLTVPNSANFRKGGDHLRIKDNTQTRTDNHTQKIRKEGFKRMNVKKKARRVMSGLLTAVTVLSTVPGIPKTQGEPRLNRAGEPPQI